MSKEYVFLVDYGFIPAGRLLKEDISGNFFLSVTDEETIAGSTPWLECRLRKEYVQSLPSSVLAMRQPGTETPTKSRVLVSCFAPAHHTLVSFFRQVVVPSGYPFFEWEGQVYRVRDGEEGPVVEDTHLKYRALPAP